jgi:hypothetical protein
VGVYAVTGQTGLLTDRCDPYGAESKVQLVGGVYPDSHVGRIMWHCDNRATGRYRMVCSGGEYGTRRAPDGGQVAAYHCEGGHQGQTMPLCLDHRREIAKRQSEACPRCLFPLDSAPLFRDLEDTQRLISQIMQYPFVDFKLVARLTAKSDQLMAAGDELIARGIVHKCGLQLVEVS